jgi:hypothetical protein
VIIKLMFDHSEVINPKASGRDGPLS